MADIENHYMDMWKDSHPKDKEAREVLYLIIQLIKKLKVQLASYHQDYKVNMENGRLDEERDNMKRNLNKVL